MWLATNHGDLIKKMNQPRIYSNAKTKHNFFSLSPKSFFCGEKKKKSVGWFLIKAEILFSGEAESKELENEVLFSF